MCNVQVQGVKQLAYCTVQSSFQSDLLLETTYFVKDINKKIGLSTLHVFGSQVI
jgi:hypothetical protein